MLTFVVPVAVHRTTPSALVARHAAPTRFCDTLLACDLTPAQYLRKKSWAHRERCGLACGFALDAHEVLARSALAMLHANAPKPPSRSRCRLKPVAAVHACSRQSSVRVTARSLLLAAVCLAGPVAERYLATRDQWRRRAMDPASTRLAMTCVTHGCRRMWQGCVSG